jgi:hypothetical protein
MTPAEREIIEFVLTLGILSEEGERVAALFLRGDKATNDEVEVFCREIVIPWFYLSCEQCQRRIPLAAIPAAIKAGEHLCRSCRVAARADVPIVFSAK